jgi:hypothetical protein
VSTRFARLAVASIVIGVILIVVTWVYLLTALSANVYYRPRISSNVWDAVLTGILPLAATWLLV